MCELDVELHILTSTHKLTHSSILSGGNSHKLNTIAHHAQVPIRNRIPYIDKLNTALARNRSGTKRKRADEGK